MKILRDYRVAGALFVNDSGVEAQVSDQVTLFLDRGAEDKFPESIVATIQHPITKVECGSMTSYVLEYNEQNISAAATLLRPQDIIDATVVSGVLVVATQLNVEIAARIAADTAEAATRLAADTAEAATRLAADTAETGARIAADTAHEADTTAHPAANIYNTAVGGITTTNVQAALAELDTLKAPKASPAFSGIVTLSNVTEVIFDTTVGTKLGTSTAQKLAFHNATPVVQRAGAAQATVAGTVGAAVVTTAPTLSAYGYTLTQATDLLARVNSLIVDNAAQTILLNEIRAALVEKGIIKGAA